MNKHNESSEILELPFLGFGSESHQSVREVLLSVEPERYFQGLRSLVLKSRVTAIIQHNTLADLLDMVGVGGLFQSISKKEKVELVNLYNWVLSKVKDAERVHTSLIGFDFETVSDLSLDVHDILVNNRLVALNARMGTGKTQRVAVPFCDAARSRGLTPIVVCNKISLCRELANRTRTEIYTDVTKKGAILTDILGRAKQNGLTICLNSLSNEAIINFLDSNKDRLALFIDEYQQTLTAFAGSHMTKYAQPCLDTLNFIMKSSKALIVADADLNDYSLSIASAIRRSKPKVYFAEKDISNKVVNISFSHGGDKFPYDFQAGAITQALEAGKKIVVYTNRQRIAVAVKMIITEFMPEKKTLLICGDNLGDEKEFEAFQNNSESESAKYDAVIMSPRVTSGVSIDNPDFDTAFCFFDNSSIPHCDAIQQMMRFRNVNTFNVVLSTQKQNADGVFLEADHFNEALEGEFSDVEFNPQQAVNRLILHKSKMTKKSCDSFAQFFTSRLQDLGYSMNLDGALTESIDSYHELKRFTDEVKQLERALIMNSPDITNAEYYELGNSEIALSREDSFKVMRYEIKKVLNVPEREPLPEWVLDFYNGGRGVGVARRFCAFGGFIDVDYTEDTEIEKGVPVVRRKYYKQCAGLFKRLLERVYEKPVEFVDMISGSLPTITNSQLGEVARFIENTALLGVVSGAYPPKRLKNVWDKKAKKDSKLAVVKISEAGQMKALREILLRFGIELESVGRTQKRGKNEHLYSIKSKPLFDMYQLGMWQDDKTKEIQKAIKDKMDALKAQSESVEVSEWHNASDESKQRYKTIAKGILAEYEDMPEGGWRWSCSKCFTPTNGYTCDTCGHHELTKVANPNALSIDKLAISAFYALNEF